MKINGFSDCDQRHIPDAEGRDNSVNMGIFIHAVVPRHIETVVLLVKLPPDDTISIKVDLSEFPVSIHDGDATYDEIKKYVLSHHGLKVSSLYISQIKRKFGLKVTEAYNKPKSENSHQPQCPPEKEKAIINALKYFKMID